MGVAVRPRQKLGGGVQGKVRIIPSSTKGKRAHPHMIAKRLVEEINSKEYQLAIASAISATGRTTQGKGRPIIVANEIESLNKTKEIVKMSNNLTLSGQLEGSKSKIRKGPRRSSRQKHYKKSLLLIVSKENQAARAARNIAGVDACSVSVITANLLAPGGVPGRVTVWSEQAIKGVEESVKRQSL